MTKNRLGLETSPYLLQHEDNPVHWWAWGPQALEEAQKTGKPILLSIGYAACHWCHVMAHESFKDQATADVMNELFVNIKVDREERPDIDAIYMAALHATGEQGGWPLTMFLTPDAKPFWGGTYFPVDARYGRPAFKDVLRQVAHIHKEEGDKVARNTKALTAHIASRPNTHEPAEITEQTLADLATRLLQAVDFENGGLQGAPKFPQTAFFDLLWRAGLRFKLSPCLKAVEITLTHICQGGIYDHLGGGFSRYSVDARWLAPHFEKMLYDNALLIGSLTQAWRETQNPLYAIRIEETIDWLSREMIAEGGAFAASLDADSEGVEGKFYVWSKVEIITALGEEDGTFFSSIYDVQQSGNWEGSTILNRLESLDLLSNEEEARLKTLRNKLLQIRDKRIRPGWDDKVLADWNGLMISSLVQASTTFDRADWIGMAEKAFDFICDNMVQNDRLSHSYRKQQVRGAAIANDYANMIGAALQLFQATNQSRFLEQAKSWKKILQDHYWDNEDGGYFFTADDTTDLIVRTKSASDDSTPNANGTMISNLVALFLLTRSEDYLSRAEEILKAFAADIAHSQVSHTCLLGAAFDLLSPAYIVIAAKTASDAKPFLDRLKTLSLPGTVIQTITDMSALPKSSPAQGKTIIDGKPTAYICVGPQCSAPLTEPHDFAATTKSLHRPSRTPD